MAIWIPLIIPTETQSTAARKKTTAKSRMLRIALSVPSFATVWHAVAAADLVCMIPRRLAGRVAGPAALDIYAMPFAIPRDELCQAWHRRNSTAWGLLWLRAQAVDILARLDDGPDPVQFGAGTQATVSSPKTD